MANILNNTTSLQEVLEALQNKAAGGGGEQATPVISVDNSTGLITATAGTKSATEQLAFQPAKTITPSTTSQIAVSSGYYTGGNITVAGDSNLTAGNIKNGVTIFGVNGTYEGSGGGSSGEAAEWSEAEDAIVTRTLSAYTNDRVTSIGVYAFTYCSKLTSINFPACKNIGYCAFSYCANLTNINFPVCTSIEDYAFDRCTKLTNASFPGCMIIGISAFQYCYNLTSASFPACTSIGSAAFSRCSSLTSIYFGKDIPSTSTSTKAYIDPYAFRYCSKLTNLTLYYPSVATLSNINAFQNTPMSVSTLTGSFGSIYVPASLVAAYKSATNWATYADRITAIPGTENNDDGLITFYIDDASYQAEEGMTWGEWVESEYNTEGFELDEDGWVWRPGVGIVYYKMQEMFGVMTIIANCSYTYDGTAM